MKKAVGDPLKYLREKTLSAITERITAQLAARFGAKVAGSWMSMAADLAASTFALFIGALP